MDSPRDEDLLESLTLLGSDEKPRVAKISGSVNQSHIDKVSWSHKDMADYMLANPHSTQNDLAYRYGYSRVWVSIVINSDAFQTYLATRREELVNPILRATIEDRMRGVAARSLEVMAEKLEVPSNMISDEFALRAASMASKALGMGTQAPAPPPPSANLSDLAERLASLARRPPNQGVVDVEAREIPKA